MPAAPRATAAEAGNRQERLPRGAAPGGERRAGARGANPHTCGANPHTKRPEEPINAPARSGCASGASRGQGGNASEEWGLIRGESALDRRRSKPPDEERQEQHLSVELSGFSVRCVASVGLSVLLDNSDSIPSWSV